MSAVVCVCEWWCRVRAQRFAEEAPLGLADVIGGVALRIGVAVSIEGYVPG